MLETSINWATTHLQGAQFWELIQESIQGRQYKSSPYSNPEKKRCASAIGSLRNAALMFTGTQNPAIILNALSSTETPFGNLILSEINGSQASLMTPLKLSCSTISSGYKETAQLLLKIRPSAPNPLPFFQCCLTTTWVGFSNLQHPENSESPLSIQVAECMTPPCAICVVQFQLLSKSRLATEWDTLLGSCETSIVGVFKGMLETCWGGGCFIHGIH